MTTVNLGFNQEQLHGLVGAIREKPERGETVWEARTQWKGGFKSEATIESYGRNFKIPMDEPTVLGGTDSAPNMVEVVLGAYGCCLTTGYVMNAAQRGIELQGVEIQLKGNLDLRGFLGLSDEVPPGYKHIDVEVTLTAPKASPEELQALHNLVLKTSPVGCIIERPLNVSMHLVTETNEGFGSATLA
jgi:uncharacterized OsmC-like protein